jgi:hypothetical protein
MISLANTEPYFGPKHSHEAWIEEAIWGHRLERQPFSALFLEFLGMAEGMCRQSKLLDLTQPGENPTYAANRCLQLRNILFNNPQMEEILRNAQASDDEAWSKWLDVMKESASLGDRLKAEFSYLRKRWVLNRFGGTDPGPYDRPPWGSGFPGLSVRVGIGWVALGREGFSENGSKPPATAPAQPAYRGA